jgi:hypothetical protein
MTEWVETAYKVVSQSARLVPKVLQFRPWGEFDKRGPSQRSEDSSFCEQLSPQSHVSKL